MKPASIVLMMVLTMAFGAQAEVTFQVDFNRATATSSNYNQVGTVLDIAQPVIARGNPEVLAIGGAVGTEPTDNSGVLAGYYGNPRGAWNSSGIGFYANYTGLQYEALDNVPKDKGTIEFWSNKDLGAVSTSMYPRYLQVEWDAGNYINIYGSPVSGDTNRIELRAWLKLSGSETDATRCRYNLLRTDWPTGEDTADGMGWNHYLVSYDRTPDMAAERWVALWLNGRKVAHVYGGNRFASSTSGNILTLGNRNPFDSNNRLMAAFDALRIHNVTVDEIYVMGPDYGNPADDPNLVKDPNNFRVPGLPGAEYSTPDNHITFLADFNTPDPEPEVVCTPSIFAGSSEVELSGTVRPGLDTEPRGVWDTLGVGLYADGTGLHYEAVNNVPRNQGTIEMYSSFDPTRDRAGQYPRLFQVWWHDHYYMQAYLNSDDLTETTTTIRCEARMGFESDKRFHNWVTFDKADWPFADSGTGMNLWAMSWQGSSAAGVMDGWIGLWVNGVLLQKMPVDQPYFWRSDVNKLAVGITAGGTHRMGGNADAVRVSVLPIPELYDVDENDNYPMSGYSGNEYGPKPQVCGDPGTQYAPGDINQDCRVDMLDVAILASEWLECTDPAEGDCW